MQLTTYILATAMAISSGAFAEDIDIAYTSDGVGHTQTVPLDVDVPLDYPGIITTFQTIKVCYLDPNNRVITGIPPGANVLDPGVEASVIHCFEKAP
ncbi:hypothetical protein ABZX51_003755 [Aspergillus tubingensis]